IAEQFEKQHVRAILVGVHAKVLEGYSLAASYHPHGVVMRECSYKEGKVDGRSKTYSVSNILMEDAEYKDGKLDGDYKLFDERTGKLVSHQVFESGKVSKVLVGDPVKRKK
ncbi:MAG: hypothetical protein ACKOW8_08425, partial [Flavobacteriales bacterium]